MIRPIRHSAVPVAALMGAVAVAILAVIGIRSFEHHADQDAVAITLVTQIRAEANARNALEWKAIAEGEVGPEARSAFMAQDDELKGTVDRLAALPDHGENATAIFAAYTAYATAVEREFAHLAAGDLEAAERVDEEQVDPSYDRLGATIAKAGVDAQRHKDATSRVQQRASWTIGGVAPTLVVGLLLLVFRLRQRAVIERVQRVALQNEMVATEAVATEREYEANHDLLTGLPNRRHFLHRLGTEVDVLRAAAHAKLAVMLIDLDRFKDVNDTLGHRAGDDVLAQIGPRLHATLRGEDVLARLGGDEFALLVPVSTDVNVGDVQTLADRLHAALEASFLVDDLPLSVTASIGIAMGPDHGDSAEELLQHADVAMYLAKQAGLGSVVYTPESDTSSRDQLLLAGELRSAFANNEIVLHYQPKINLASGEVIGVEALARWQHPRRGMLSPAEFLPVVERTGMTRHLTSCVLEQALAQVAGWERDGLSLRVAVNLSVADLLDAGLPDEIAALLWRHGVDGSRLQLEVTENVFMTAPERVAEVIGRLADDGVTLSLDDFGAGYSSLAHLRRLCVDELKIDRSFVTNIVTDAFDAAVVRSTVGLGHSLHLRVVGEGVETEATLDELREHGCDEAQGYFIRRPASAAELTPWLREHFALGVFGSGGSTAVE